MVVSVVNMNLAIMHAINIQQEIVFCNDHLSLTEITGQTADSWL